MDPVFEALTEKIRARVQTGGLTPVEIDQLNECLELLEKISGDIEAYSNEFKHLRDKSQFFMEIAKNKRNRELEIVFTTLSANYFRWWPS
jgi:FtsZ-binding cell division protein ZapB